MNRNNLNKYVETLEKLSVAPGNSMLNKTIGLNTLAQKMYVKSGISYELKSSEYVSCLRFVLKDENASEVVTTPTKLIEASDFRIKFNGIDDCSIPDGKSINQDLWKTIFHIKSATTGGALYGGKYDVYYLKYIKYKTKYLQLKRVSAV